MLNGILIFGMIFVLLAMILVAVLFNPPLESDEQIKEKVTKNNEYDEEFFKSLSHQELKIKSENGYSVHALLYKNNSNRYIIYTHGLRWNHMGGYKFMELYYSLCGFNVLIYDTRRHGKTGGKDITWGYYEKYDLKACVDYLREIYGEDIVVGVHGESIGASITIEYLGIEKEKNIDFIIEEGGFSDINKLFSKVLKQKIKIKGKLILFMVNIISKIRKGYSFLEISPEKVISKIEAPMLFIHGDSDQLVPLSMALDLYEKKKGYKELYIVKGGQHSKSYYADYIGFNIAIISFLININVIDSSNEHFEYFIDLIKGYNKEVDNKDKFLINEEITEK